MTTHRMAKVRRRRPSGPPPGFPPLPPRAARRRTFARDPAVQHGCIPMATRDDASSNEDSTKKRPRLFSDYDEEIDISFKTRERNPAERPSPEYMETVQQNRIRPTTRRLLIMYMHAFVRCYHLPDGTLHAAVDYVDRFLSAKPLPPPPPTTTIEYQLRLLGLTAVFTAAKFDDQSTVRKLSTEEIALYGNFSSAEEVMETEATMLSTLGYAIGGPTAYTFVGHFTSYYSEQEEEDMKIRRLACRIADRWLEEYESLRFLPSAVAASAILLARIAVPGPRQPWSAELQQVTGYGFDDLEGCVHAMYPCSRPVVSNLH